MREMQQDLFQGFLQFGWTAVEFLPVDDGAAGEDWLRAVQ
jgi:hypothetical protein